MNLMVSIDYDVHSICKCTFLLLIFLQLLHLIHSDCNPAGHAVTKRIPRWFHKTSRILHTFAVPRGKTHRPAMCAGVVAKGYSLALPDESTTIGAAFLVVDCS